MQRILILFLLIGIQSCSSQKQVIDYSFTFLDKWGLTTGYEMQFVTKSKAQLDDGQKERLFLETKRIASAYGREFELVDFVFKRDSIEIQFTSEIVKQMMRKSIEIGEINIVNLMVPKQIGDAIAQRVKLLGEPHPTRIKIIEK